MAWHVSTNNSHLNEWVQTIWNATFLVDHIHPLDTYRVIKHCESVISEKMKHTPTTCAPIHSLKDKRDPTPKKSLKCGY